MGFNYYSRSVNLLYVLYLIIIIPAESKIFLTLIVQARYKKNMWTYMIIYGRIWRRISRNKVIIGLVSRDEINWMEKQHSGN